MRVGPQTERTYSRGHYRDLLASFTGSQLLTGRHGASEIGFIDPTVLIGEEKERLLLLAGRSWRVTEVDWTKRIVWMEPASSGGKARWRGSARSIEAELCQGIRTVLASGVSNTISLSRRAKVELERLSDEIPASQGTHFLTSRTNGGPLHTWTFAGTKVNRTLARQASDGGSRIRFDALGVQAPLVVAFAAPPNSGSLTAGELAELRKAIKFADCLPSALVSRTVIARFFDSNNPN